MTIRQHLGKQIKKRREATGLTQEQLGQILGLSRASVINMQTGRHMPTIEGFHLLCQIFGCQPNDLLPEAKKIKLESYENKVNVIKVKIVKQYSRV